MGETIVVSIWYHSASNYIALCSETITVIEVHNGNQKQTVTITRQGKDEEKIPENSIPFLPETIINTPLF